jgi:hypothetical protein
VTEPACHFPEALVQLPYGCAFELQHRQELAQPSGRDARTMDCANLTGFDTR